MIKYRLILYILGLFLLIEAFYLSTSLIVSVVYQENDILSFVFSTSITLLSGLSLFLPNRKINKKIGKRESLLIVSLCWIFISIFGALPYLFYWNWDYNRIIDAVFESISGFTTTGSTILENPETMPHGILFWRSLTQFIGGLGIIIFSMTIISFIKSDDTKLFNTESGWMYTNKLHPRLKNTAFRIVILYVCFIILETILLMVGGVSFFDAVCHSFTTMSSGGFSTKLNNTDIFNTPYLQYIIICFMLISGINFSLIFFGITGRFAKIIKNSELKFYLSFIIIISLIVCIGLIFSGSHRIEEAFRASLFQVSSIITTTGFSIDDYMQWKPDGIWIMLFFIMIVGGSSGSTSGGIKMLRIHVLLKNISNEFKKILHPHVILPLRYNGKNLSRNNISNILNFCILYAIIVVIGTIIMNYSKDDLSPITAFGATVSSLGNVGISIQEIGHQGIYYTMSFFGKVVLCFLMLIGRLELYVVLILFTRGFWKH